MKSTLSLFIALLAMQGTIGCRGEATRQPPNILFIFADDWGFGDLGCFGNDEIQTPELDAFAAQCRRFTRFHVTSGVCSPSRVSIMTGHYPARYRVHGHFAGNEVNAKRGMPNWLPDSITVTLPRLLKEAGYATAHFGKWHLGGGGPPNGDTTAPQPVAYGYDESRVWNGNGPTWNGTTPWEHTRYLDDDTTWNQHAAQLAVDAAIDFARRHQQDGPFFINLWLKEPHAPLVPSAEQRRDFLRLAEPKQTYYAVIREADRQIGRLLAQLKAMGALENTLIVFSSDNGPEYPNVEGAAGSAGRYRGGKRSLYEGGVCVPFMVYWKDRVPPGTVDSTTILSSTDLLPTFCSIAGSPLPAHYVPDGEDITAAWTAGQFQRAKPLFWEWRFPAATHPHLWMDAAIMDQGYKLVQNTRSGRAELYDILDDPEERHNLADGLPETVDALRKRWEQWKQALRE